MNDLWERLSSRERRLGIATAGVVLAALAALLTMRAFGRIAELDKDVRRLEDQFLNYSEQEARGVSVDKAFEQVAAQHSSAWTEAEIHNRLRQEIYRLALEDPNAPAGTSKNLVEFPSLRQGTLKEGGAGYREYQLSIGIPSTDIASIVKFLVRLQSSAQSLRIDGLELARSPNSQFIVTNINVTRIVVAGSPADAPAETPAAPPAPPPGMLMWDGQRLDDWKAQDCSIDLVAEPEGFNREGGNCLKVRATGPNAVVYTVCEVEAGVPQELMLEVAAKSPAAIQVVNDADGQPLEGVEKVVTDGKPYRYRLLFTITGASGATVKVRAPCVTLKTPDGLIYIDNVTLRKVADSG